MAINLIEMLTSQMSGSVLSQASKFLGESENSTKSAMGAALPAILGSMIQNGSSQSGAQGIMDMITKGGFDGSMLNNIGSMFGGGDATSGLMNQGSSILSSLMGNKMGAIVDVISKVSGMGSKSSSSLMGMLAPLIMSAIGKQVMGKGVSGLMSFLGSQAGFVKAAAPPALSSLMGLSNMGAMGNKAMETANAAVNDTAEAGSSLMKKLMPLGLVALLALGLLYFFRGNSVVDAANTVAETATSAADAAANAAGNAADAAGDMANAAGDAVADAADATMAAAKKALDGVTFAAGSVGEKFNNFLNSGAEGNGEAFSFANLTFNTGSAEITSTTMTEVDNLAAVLNAYPNIHIEVGGHTDNTGDAAKNNTLSADRAMAVKARLMELGIGADRITTKGYGSSMPVADNSTEAGRQQNRRIEVKITQR